METFTEAGDPKETISDAVQKYKIKLLVMGSHANRTVKRLVASCEFLIHSGNMV